MPGDHFANALPAGVLAYSLQAPMLLTEKTAKQSTHAFEFIKNNLSPDGTIYIVSDENLIQNDFNLKLKEMGYENIIRIQGKDKYETDYLIAEYLNISEGTPIVLSSGENFPDALSISSFAAAKGWPILLTDKNSTPEAIQNFIKNKRPSTIYITGGEAAISLNVEQTIKKLAPNATIVRFNGSDRYQTAIMIAERFNPNPSILYVASGTNFPDSLTGGVLAAKTNSPIMLINPATKKIVPNPNARYLVNLRNNQTNLQVVALGGEAAVPEETLELVNDLGGNLKLTSFGNPVEFKYYREPYPEDRWAGGTNLTVNTGELTDDQEIALITALKYINGRNTKDYRLGTKNTYGTEYCTEGFAKSLKKELDKPTSPWNEKKVIQINKKITFVEAGTQKRGDRNYIFFRFTAASEVSKNMGEFEKGFAHHYIILRNTNGYWEVDDSLDTNYVDFS